MPHEGRFANKELRVLPPETHGSPRLLRQSTKIDFGLPADTRRTAHPGCPRRRLDDATSTEMAGRLAGCGCGSESSQRRPWRSPRHPRACADLPYWIAPADAPRWPATQVRTFARCQVLAREQAVPQARRGTPWQIRRRHMNPAACTSFIPRDGQHIAWRHFLNEPRRWL
jgi:hypothetical protein